MSLSQIPHANLNDLFEWWRSAWDIFQSHWWLWMLFGVLQIAVVVPTARLPQFWSVVSRYLLGACFSFISAVLAISFVSRRSFISVLTDNFSSVLIGFLVLTVWIYLVNRYIEVPILKLFANTQEQSIYAGSLKDAKIAPRWWVDVIHSLIILSGTYFLILMPSLIMAKKFNAYEALLISIAVVGLNAPIFLIEVMGFTLVHTFIRRPLWIFAIQVGLFMLVVGPLLNIANVTAVLHLFN